MKVLVIRFSSIGDIVLTSPVLRCLKAQVPHIKVHYLTKASFEGVVGANPNIDKCYFLKDNYDELISSLKKEKYDYIIDLHKNLRSLRIKQALKCKSFSFNKLNIQKWLLVNLKINLLPDISIVERYIDTVRQLGVKNDGEGLDYYIPEGLELNNRDIPMSHWAGYIACVIGGSYNTKKYPVEKWIDFCKKSPYPIILLGGPDDKEEGDQIAAVDNIKVYNSCGKFSLNESALLVKFSRFVVSNDTGLMHIASALNKNVISLWGNTVPEMGMFPYYGNNNLNKTVSNKFKILEVRGLGCRPCSKIGYDKCPRGHFKCMKNINEDGFLKYVENYWSQTQP